MEEILFNEYGVNLDAKVTKMSKENRNDVWKVETEGQKFVLKEANIKTRERAEYLINIENRLIDISPKIVKNKSGKQYIIINKKYYIMFEFEEGKQYNRENIPTDLIENIGTFLGIMHRKLRNITEENRNNQNSLLNISYPNLQIMNRLIEENNSNKEFIELIKNKIKVLSEYNYEDLLRQMLNRRKQIIHGDFYLGNLIFGKEIKAIDYEQAGLFYKEYEFAHAVFMICYNSNADDATNFEKIRMFAREYKKEERIDVEFAVDLFIYSLANSLYCFEKWKDETTEQREYALYRCNLLLWVKKNKETIIKLLRG